MTTPSAPSAHAARELPPPPPPLAALLGGFLMGSADVVPGVSGGTVALVFGIYERLVSEVRVGASALAALLRGDVRGALDRLRGLAWGFVVPLGIGILLAVLSLASVIEHLLDEQPIALSGAFLGLVAGSVIVAIGMVRRRTPETLVLGVVTAVVTFVVLGARSGTVDDPTLAIYVAGGALAVCAMILPGISGSFILLLIGLYDPVIDAVSDRDLAIVGAVAIGAVAGLAMFSTLLQWLLDRYHDRVLAALIGLMAGSMRVLWPWPAGEDGVGDTGLQAPGDDLGLALLLAAVGFVVVLGVARLGAALAGSEVPDEPIPADT